MAKGKAMKVKKIEPRGLTVQNKKVPVVVIIFAIIVVIGLAILIVAASQAQWGDVKLNLATPVATTPDETEEEAEEETPDNSGGITELATDDTKKGKGTAAKNGDKVEVIYTGKLYTTGEVFDATANHPEDKYPNGKPMEITLGEGNVIPGFEQGIVGMKVGGKRTVTIPPDLAYGSDGQGDSIPPNATLVFELELVSIKAKAKSK
jgi:FKBP-type peptidyl-prolyl cis-trans isomerase FkpA